MRQLLAPMIKLAIFLVVTVVATAILGLTIASRDVGDSNTYAAEFTDVTGVFPGDDVRMSGVKVGQIDSVRIVNRTNAQVRFTVESTRTLPKTVHAKLKYLNLIGQRYLSLELAAGNGGTPLRQGDVIPLAQTQPALNLTVLFNGFKPLFQALNPDDVNKLSFEIIQTLQGEGGTINQLLAHTASATTAVAKKDQVIGQVINNLNTVLDTVNQRSPELDEILGRTQELVSGLAQQREPIGNAVNALDRLSNTTANLVTEGRPPLQQSIHGLGEVATNLDDRKDLVAKFVRTLPNKTAKLTKTASYGSWFNFYMCDLEGKVGISSLDLTVPLTPGPATEPAERCRR